MSRREKEYEDEDFRIFFDRVLIPISFFESPTFLESGICLPTNEYKK